MLAASESLIGFQSSLAGALEVSHYYGVEFAVMSFDSRNRPIDEFRR
jgi:hypothetical protein